MQLNQINLKIELLIFLAVEYSFTIGNVAQKLSSHEQSFSRACSMPGGICCP